MLPAGRLGHVLHATNIGIGAECDSVDHNVVLSGNTRGYYWFWSRVMYAVRHQYHSAQSKRPHFRPGQHLDAVVDSGRNSGASFDRFAAHAGHVTTDGRIVGH